MSVLRARHPEQTETRSPIKPGRNSTEPLKVPSHAVGLNTDNHGGVRSRAVPGIDSYDATVVEEFRAAGRLPIVELKCA
jgi:hypothetical protein